MTDENGDQRLDEALALGVRKCLRDARTLPSFPHVTRDGRWLVGEHGRWTAGFFVGMLWIAHLLERDPATRDLALAWARRLTFRATDRSTHDMGFLFEPSHVRGFRIGGQPSLRDGAIVAARSLASRFHPRGRFIPAWSPEEDPAYAALAIVDTVMNVPILLWAARQCDDEDLWRTGLETARTIRAQHVRGDGSTWHVVDHDPATGAVTSRGTHQGAHAGSCWSRGQAWAIQGFTKVAMMTGEAEFLETARRLADHYLDRLGAAVVPPWDFDRPAAREPRDSAAAAIAASGLLDLERASGVVAYADQGRRIALGLAAEHIDFERPDAPGLLTGGAVDVPRNSGVGESIQYGDHYYMEALMKLRHPEERPRLGCADD